MKIDFVYFVSHSRLFFIPFRWNRIEGNHHVKSHISLNFWFFWRVIYKTFWPQFAPDMRLYLRNRSNSPEVEIMPKPQRREGKFHSHISLENKTKAKTKKSATWRLEPVPIIIHSTSKTKYLEIIIISSKLRFRPSERPRKGSHKPNGTGSRKKLSRACCWWLEMIFGNCSGFLEFL